MRVGCNRAWLLRGSFLWACRGSDRPSACLRNRMAAKESEQQMNKTMRDLLRQLYEIETIAGDFTQPNSQDLLVARLQELQQGLQQFRDRAAAFKKSNVFQVPNQLFEFIDSGGHPEDFVRLSFTRAVQDNQTAAGRVAAIAALRDELLAQAKEAFPDDTAVYSAIVERKEK